MFSLSRRVALVTGASRGLGLAIAQGLAEAGAMVAINGRDHAALEATAGKLRDQGLRVEASVL
jgi:gluconate 5-dehydrogenase